LSLADGFCLVLHLERPEALLACVGTHTTAAPSKELFEVLEGTGNAELAKLEFPTKQ
jgi:hypothetical protein